MIDTLLLKPSLHFTTLQPNTLHYACRHFTSAHLNLTQIHFITLHCPHLVHVNLVLQAKCLVLGFQPYYWLILRKTCQIRPDRILRDVNMMCLIYLGKSNGRVGINSSIPAASAIWQSLGRRRWGMGLGVLSCPKWKSQNRIRSPWSNQSGSLKYHVTAELTCLFLVSNTSAAVFCCVYCTADGAIACCRSNFTALGCTSWDTCGWFCGS
jgi:hypothetical protein